jgi:hypothetical protein
MGDRNQYMVLTQPEIKLVLRLRQLKNCDETRLFMVSTNPLTLSVMGNIELLEVSGSSIRHG